MRRATDINDAFHFIGCRVDERDRIRSNRYHGKGFGIRRITKSVNKKLSFVERTKRSRHWIAKSNHAEQLILRRVNYGNGIGSLVRRVNAIVTGDRNIWPSPGRLFRHSAWQKT